MSIGLGRASGIDVGAVPGFDPTLGWNPRPSSSLSPSIYNSRGPDHLRPASSLWMPLLTILRKQTASPSTQPLQPFQQDVKLNGSYALADIDELLVTASIFSVSGLSLPHAIRGWVGVMVDMGRRVGRRGRGFGRS